MQLLPIEEWDGTGWAERNRQFRVEEDFPINEDDLDRELCRMGQLLVHYGSAWAELKAQVARHQEEQEAAYAEKARSVRATRDKITADAVKEEVRADPSYRWFVQRTNRSEGFLAQADIWYRSMHRRAECLNALAYKANRELKLMGGGSM